MKRKNKKKKPSEFEIRNEIARAAWEHTGAGKHGGDKKSKRRAERKRGRAEARDWS
jgi:hypothetical protein